MITSPCSHSQVEIHSSYVCECDCKSSFAHILLHSLACFDTKEFCFYYSFQVMAPKRKSSNIGRGESSAPLDIHPRWMRLRSWTNLKPTRLKRPCHSPVTRLGYLHHLVPIVIDSSNSEDTVLILEPNLSSKTKSSSELEPIPVSEPTPASSICL